MNKTCRYYLYLYLCEDKGEADSRKRYGGGVRTTTDEKLLAESEYPVPGTGKWT